MLFSVALRDSDVLAQLHKAADTCLGIATDYGMKGNTVFPLGRESVVHKHPVLSH